MRVQVDRYNPSVLIPNDPTLGALLLAISVIAFISFLLVTGMTNKLKQPNIKQFALELIAAASRQNEGRLWLALLLLGTCVICLFGASLVYIATFFEGP